MSSKPQNAQKAPTAQQQQQQQRKKMPKLPKNATVTKRPLLHPQIPSKHTGPSTQKTIYLSTRTPFMSAIKRTERHLAAVEKRALQSATAHIRNEQKSKKRKFGAYSGGGGGGADDYEAGGSIVEIAKRAVEERGEGEGGVGFKEEEVVVKATGKAIQKALGVGLWFQGREGYGVLIRTGTVRAIDDVEVAEDEEGGGVEEGREGGKGGDQRMRDVQEEEKDGKVAEEVPETRIRSLSTIEVAVYRK